MPIVTISIMADVKRRKKMLELSVVAIFTVIAYVIACFLGMQGLILALTTIAIVIIMIATLFYVIEKKI